jgi:hypothetical protein
MTEIEVILHLPGIVIETGGGFSLGMGRVEALSFKQWQQLDPSFGFAEENFTKSRPVFWIGVMSIKTIVSRENLSDVSCEIKEIANNIAHKVHSSFLLGSALAWVPTPILSAIYCRVFFDGLVATLRFIGPMEREWIVYGSDVKVSYDETTISQVDWLFKWLEKYHPLSCYQSASTGLSVLERTTRPDNWWGDAYKLSVNDFIHCVTACEDILLQPNTKNLTDTFGCHAAVLMASTYSEIKQMAKIWSDVYRLRTQLMHGKIRLDDLDHEARKSLPMARKLLRKIIISVLSLQVHDNEALPSLLVQAFSDPIAYTTLHQRLKTRHEW